MVLNKKTAGRVIDDCGPTRFTALCVFALFAASVFDGIDYMMVPYTMSQIAQEWQLDSIASGSLTSWGMLGLCVGDLATGIIADHTGRKGAIIITVVCFSILTAIIYFAPNYPLFALLRFMTGFALGGLMPLTMASCSELVPSKGRPIFITVVACAMTVGYVISSLISMAIIPVFGWRSVYLFGLLGLPLALWLWKVLPESPNWLLANGKNEEAFNVLVRFCKSAGREIDFTPDTLLPPKSGGKEGGNRLSFRGLFNTKEMAKKTIGLWMIYFCILFGVYGINAWLPTLLLNKDFALAGAYGISLANNAAGILGNLSMGFLIERIGRKRGLVTALLLTAASVVLMAYISGGTVVLLIASLLMGYFLNMSPGAMATIASETYPTETRGTGTAFMQSIGRLAGFVAPILIGAVVGIGVDFSTTMCIFAIPPVIGAILALIFIQQEKRGIELD